MAVTLFHKYHIIVNNKVTIKNNKDEELKKEVPTKVQAKIRGKTYGRRTINR